MSARIEPRAALPPFKSADGRYHCKCCSSYTFNFCRSFIARRYRVCKACNRQNRKREVSGDSVTRLRRLLYKSVHNKGFPQFAKALTNDAILSILKLHGSRPDQVTRIVPPMVLSEISDLSRYGVVKFVSRK